MKLLMLSLSWGLLYQCKYCYVQLFMIFIIIGCQDLPHLSLFSMNSAPMSRVVDYLPPDIPRILINRNIVTVPKQSTNEQAGSFTFHACLLGNCDDVVKALEAKMKGGDDEESTDNQNESNRLVTSNEKWLQNQPKESVLLFTGAVISGTKEPETQQKLVVHCDECQNVIEGKIYCCKTCFDYDLCGDCFPNSSLVHANGSHEFVVET